MPKNNKNALARDFLMLPNRIKRTARVLIMRYRKDELQFFALWQQKKHKDIERLVLPGGQIKISYSKNREVKQEKIIETAIRETSEEISFSELNIKYYLGVLSRKMRLKTNHKHTYVFLGKIRGKPKVLETEKFNSEKSRFYSFDVLDKYAHAPHLRWIYKQYKKGKLEKPIVKYIR